MCPISIPKESHVWSLKQLWHLLNVFGANWETADKEKAALAELLPHIMDVQTEAKAVYSWDVIYTPAQPKPTVIKQPSLLHISETDLWLYS